MKIDEEQFFKANVRVIHRAVIRVHVFPSSELYDELFQVGSIAYLEYLRKFQDALSTDQEIIRFNQIAGNIVYKKVLQVVQQTQRNWAKFNVRELESLVFMEQEPACEDDHSLMDFNQSAFFDTLKRDDLKILYLHTTGLTNKQIAASMPLSEATISRRLRNMRRQLTQTLKGEDKH